MSNKSAASAGFSNQQALLALIIAFPLGLIGLGLIMSVLMRSPSTTTTAKQEPATERTEPQESASVPTTPPVQQEVKPSIKPMESPQTPLTNDSSQRSANGNTCWFQAVRGGTLTGSRCQVRSRINANNDRVFDVIEPSGTKRSIVLWDNDEVEVFLRGTRYVGTWYEDSDGDVRIDLPGGSFAFRPSN